MADMDIPQAGGIGPIPVDASNSRRLGDPSLVTEAERDFNMFWARPPCVWVQTALRMVAVRAISDEASARALPLPGMTMKKIVASHRWEVGAVAHHVDID